MQASGVRIFLGPPKKEISMKRINTANEHTEGTYDIIRNWLKNRNLESTVPVEDFLPNDLTEASLLINFWIEQGVIYKKE